MSGAHSLDLRRHGLVCDSAGSVTAEDALIAATRTTAPTAVLASPQDSVSICESLALLVPELRALSISASAGQPSPAPPLPMRSLSSLSALTGLTFSHCPGILGSASALAGCLSKLPQLQALQLRNVGLRPDMCGQLAAALARASALTALDLSGNLLELSGWSALACVGLPAALAVLDVRNTFHDRSQQRPGRRPDCAPVPDDHRSPPSVRLLACALRACSRLQQLRVGPRVANLTGEGFEHEVGWTSLCSPPGSFAGLRELQGAGALSTLPPLPALSNLTWQVQGCDPGNSVDRACSALAEMSTLRALHLTYVVRASVEDAAHQQLFHAVGALTGLTALRIRVELEDCRFDHGVDIDGLVEDLRALTGLCVLDLHLDGSPYGSDYGYGAELLALNGMTSLRTFALRVIGGAETQSQFQLRTPGGLRFVPASVRELTLQVPGTSEKADFTSPLSCTQLTTLRMATGDSWEAVDPYDPPEEAGDLPRLADAISYRLKQLQWLQDLQLEQQLHEPYVLEALAALPSLTALEVLRLCSDMPGFPQLVVVALAGCTALRQLTIMHNAWPDMREAVTAGGVLLELVRFDRLERVGLYRSCGEGAHVQLTAEEVGRVIARLPCLELVVAGYDPQEWARAEAYAGRSVRFATFRSGAVCLYGPERWTI